jgi:hypothetical protein
MWGRFRWGVQALLIVLRLFQTLQYVLEKRRGISRPLAGYYSGRYRCTTSCGEMWRMAMINDWEDLAADILP